MCTGSVLCSHADGARAVCIIPSLWCSMLNAAVLNQQLVGYGFMTLAAILGRLSQFCLQGIARIRVKAHTIRPQLPSQMECTPDTSFSI